MASAIWDARKSEHLGVFRREVLAPLIAATRPPDLRTPEAVNDAARAWILSLKDVPADVLTAGVEALLLEGPTWMPRPGDLRRVCAGVVAAQRKAIAARQALLTADCEDCHGSSWVVVVDADGVQRATRCGCHVRALSLAEGLPALLSLPPAEREDVA